MKLTSFCFSLILTLTTTSWYACIDPIREDTRFASSLKQEKDSVHVRFYLYRYNHENFVVSAGTNLQDSSFAIQEFSYLIASLLLIEHGSVFDAHKPILINQRSVSLQEAFHQKDSMFFASLLNQVPPETLQLLTKKLGLGGIRIQNMEQLFQMHLSPDQILGLMSKLYYRKLPFQERTYDIIEKLFTEQAFSPNKFFSCTSDIQEHRTKLISGWIEKGNETFFILLSLSTPSKSTLSAKDQARYLQKTYNYLSHTYL